MTPERARRLLELFDPFNGGFPQTGAEVITPEEDSYINMIWSLMSDSTSYYDAVKAIAGNT